jgi:hypothetical protein
MTWFKPAIADLHASNIPEVFNLISQLTSAPYETIYELLARAIRSGARAVLGTAGILLHHRRDPSLQRP